MPELSDDELWELRTESFWPPYDYLLYIYGELSAGELFWAVRRCAREYVNQDSLSQSLGICKLTLINIEKGHRRPTKDKMSRLLSLVGYPMFLLERYGYGKY